MRSLSPFCSADRNRNRMAATPSLKLACCLCGLRQNRQRHPRNRARGQSPQHMGHGHSRFFLSGHQNSRNAVNKRDQSKPNIRWATWKREETDLHWRTPTKTFCGQLLTSNHWARHRTTCVEFITFILHYEVIRLSRSCCPSPRCPTRE